MIKMASKGRPALPPEVEVLISQTHQMVRKWTLEDSKRFLASKVKKDTPKRTEDQIRRAFVPTNIFHDSIYMTTTLLVGPQGFGKTTTGRYWASALTDDWLDGSIFRYDPLIIFTNSLRMGIKLIEQQYDGHDYIYLFIDDAIRHQSSKNVFSVGARRLINELAEIRHILEDDCNVEPPCCLNMIWSTQRFRELGPLVRSCDRAVYKGLSTLGGDKEAVYREVGPEAYAWLLQINRMVKQHQRFDYLSHFVLIFDPEELPDYCVVDADWTQLYEYPMIKDDFGETNIRRIVDYVIRYFEKDKDFHKIAHRSLGISVIKAVIRKAFPESVIPMQEVIDEIKFHYWKEGKYKSKSELEVQPHMARQYKYRFWRTMYYLLRLMEEKPERHFPLAAMAGYNNIKSLRRYVNEGLKLYQPIEFPPPIPESQARKSELNDLWRALYDDIKDFHEKRGIRADGLAEHNRTLDGV